MRLTVTDSEYHTLMNALTSAMDRFKQCAHTCRETPAIEGLALQFDKQITDTSALYAKLDQQGDDQDPTNCMADAINQAEAIASLHPQLRVRVTRPR